MNIQYYCLKGLVVHFAPHEMDTALLVLNFLVDNHESEIAQEQIQYFIDLINNCAEKVKQAVVAEYLVAIAHAKQRRVR